jgi:hypothetical protein
VKSLLLQFHKVAVVMLLPVMGALVLLEPDGRRQSGIEEAKYAKERSRRCIAVLNLVELDREIVVLINMLLAMVLPFKGIGDPLVALEA